MKNWKRTTMSLLLTGCLAVSCVPISAAAADMQTIAEDTETRATGGKCGENVAWSLDNGALIISGTGSMTEYDADRLPWYSSRSSIKTVEILNGVTSISKYAFADCTRLSSVKIPDTVKTIGQQAFGNCDSLTSITIPNSVTTLGYEAFMDCSGLKSVVLGTGLTEIDVWTFNNCTSLTDVTIGGGITLINKEAFTGCKALTTITIPDSVSMISEKAFNSCTALKNIYIGKGMRTIETDAFLKCEALKNVYFTGDEALWKTITIDSGNDKLTAAKLHYEYVRPSTVFSDVNDEAYYADSVIWAYQKNITNGKTASTFDPMGICTRAQVATFLWRAKGSPEPTSTESVFTDVKDSGKYYYRAVLWAAEQKITAGKTATTFAPDETVTRGQFVTFLYRAAGSPKYTATNPFTDVPTGKFYTDAVLWAVQNSITAGMTEKTFVPNGSCTRGQVVTFLKRNLG